MEQEELEISPYQLQKRKNGLLLSDDQISILRRNHIQYESFSNIKSLLFAIEEELNEDPNYDEELERVSEDLSEQIYYHDTNK